MFSGKQHSKFDPRDRGLNRIQKSLQRFFPERQLIVRSGERMRTLRLSTNRQAALVIAALVLGAWTLFSSGLAMNHSERIGAKNIEVKDARMGYEQLLAQVTIYKDRVAVLTDELDQNYTKSLKLMKNKTAAHKSVADALELQNKGNSRSGKSKNKVNASRDSLVIDKAKLDLDHADEERNALMEELSDLENSMLNVVAHHQETPFVTTDSLELRQVALQRDLAMAEREKLIQKIGSLEGEIRNMESNQLLLYHRFSEVAETKITGIENSLSITGLDVDLLLKTGPASRRQGGPFVPLAPVIQNSGLLQESLYKLNAKLDRLQELQGLLARMPLDAPLDNFHLTDRFGVRKDPFTGRFAQHLGLDLAGTYKGSVFSSGSGKVVHAGWKGSYGRLVEIDHGMGLISRYAHLAKISVEEGQVVERGTRLGQQGCTGRCTGDHLHFEVLYNNRHLNPLKFLRAGTDVFKE